MALFASRLTEKPPVCEACSVQAQSKVDALGAPSLSLHAISPHHEHCWKTQLIEVIKVFRNWSEVKKIEVK